MFLPCLYCPILQNLKDDWHWAPIMAEATPRLLWRICHFVAGLENLAHWTIASFDLNLVASRKSSSLISSSSFSCSYNSRFRPWIWPASVDSGSRRSTLATIRVFRLRVRLYIVCENLLILAPKTPAPIKVWLDQLVEVLSVFGRGVLPMNLKRAMH